MTVAQRRSDGMLPRAQGARPPTSSLPPSEISQVKSCFVETVFLLLTRPALDFQKLCILARVRPNTALASPPLPRSWRRSVLPPLVLVEYPLYILRNADV